mgnify:FL=1
MNAQSNDSGVQTQPITHAGESDGHDGSVKNAQTGSMRNALQLELIPPVQPDMFAPEQS